MFYTYTPYQKKSQNISTIIAIKKIKEPIKTNIYKYTQDMITRVQNPTKCINCKSY